MIEFGCHGGSVPARRVLAACLEAGARQARRGEFTERAFLGGRLDLVQAEAVADIVAAETPRGLELALGQLEGGLSDRLAGLRSALVSMRSEIEAAIDFPDDVQSAETTRTFLDACASALEEIDSLLETCEAGAAVREGASVAIVGKPNVGKSSLMNALLMRDRSIVTKAPGTTRDAIEESLHLDGAAVRLVDTAGWRAATDEAERAGVERAKAAAAGATVVLFVVDGSSEIGAEDVNIASTLDLSRTIVVANKEDLGRALAADDVIGLFRGAARTGGMPAARPADERRGSVRVNWVSALSGTGLRELRAVLAAAVLGADHAESVCVSNVRHIDALKRVRAALEAARASAEEGRPGELTASELADATSALGEISGETTSEEVLRRIFDRFCIGK
jgi:tRNA modification GTPase